MATVTGSLDSGSGRLDFSSPRSLGVTLGSNVYPDGTISFSGIQTSGFRLAIGLLDCDIEITGRTTGVGAKRFGLTHKIDVPVAR